MKTHGFKSCIVINVYPLDIYCQLKKLLVIHNKSPRFMSHAISILLTNQSQLQPKTRVRGAQSHIGKHLKSHCRPRWRRLAWRLWVPYHAYFSTGLFYLTWRIFANAYTWISNIMCKLSKPSYCFSIFFAFKDICSQIGYEISFFVKNFDFQK